MPTIEIKVSSIRLTAPLAISSVSIGDQKISQDLAADKTFTFKPELASTLENSESFAIKINDVLAAELKLKDSDIEVQKWLKIT